MSNTIFFVVIRVAPGIVDGNWEWECIDKQKVLYMKKYLLVVLAVVFVYDMACAGYTYSETETITTYERVSVDASCGCGKRFVSSRDVKPCANKTGPVRVKTHTEIIDHYQVYQPVTFYQPVGSQIRRRIVK